MKTYTIDQSAAEQRLDRYIAKLYIQARSGEIQRWIRTKKITVNRKKSQANQRLQLNDEVQVYLNDAVIAQYAKRPTRPMPAAANLKIAYEDDDILIVDKPVGLLTHPDKSEYKNTLVSYVLTYLHEAITPTFKPASINRLDKNTSGLVMFGKTYSALKHYNALMRHGDIHKTYTAIAMGHCKQRLELKAHLVHDAARNKVQLVSQPTANSKAIYTEIMPLAIKGEYSKVAIRLYTGRTHQIRISMAYLGHPLVGDVKYGGAKRMGVTTQLLHASQLAIGELVVTSQSDAIERFWQRIKE